MIPGAVFFPFVALGACAGPWLDIREAKPDPHNHGCHHWRDRTKERRPKARDMRFARNRKPTP